MNNEWIINGWINGQMDQWTNGWINGQMDQWTDE